MNRRKNQAKRLVMQPLYRQRVVSDKTKYSRKTKHKKAPISGGFFMFVVCGENVQVFSYNQALLLFSSGSVHASYPWRGICPLIKFSYIEY